MPLVAGHALVNDTFSLDAGYIGDTMERRAVFSQGTREAALKRDNTSTTYHPQWISKIDAEIMAPLTALKIVKGVNTIPGLGTPPEDTASCHAVQAFHVGAIVQIALGMSTGARFVGSALPITLFVRFCTDTLSRVICWVGSVSVVR